MRRVLPYQLTRPLQIAFLLLLVVSCAQVGWWIVDQFAYTAEVRSAQRRAYDAHALAVRALLRTGTGWTDVHRLYPHLRLGPGSAVSVAPDVLRDLDHERFHRLNRYAWEGGFFLLVLLGAMAVVYRTLEEEAALRRIRERARLLVACGTCACFGGISAMDTVMTREQMADLVYGRKRAGYEIARVDMVVRLRRKR